jgi:N-acetylmuramoyl-L-alanine amidase
LKSKATFKADSKLAHDIRPAINVEARRGVKKPSLLILHYTGMPDAERAIKWLACEESKVSCHYVIDHAGRITQMVPERLRAWHAGQSFWRGETDINSHSIGIEIQNPGHAHGYPAFPKAQMQAVIALSRDIVTRHAMKPGAVLAHSDVAPQRKIDPGEKFSWADLADNGLGQWVKPSPVRAEDEGLCVGSKGDAIRKAQKQLSAYGYDVSPTGELDAKTSHVIRAFQLHFRPRRVDGRLDRSTLATLSRLLLTAGLGH